MGVTKWTEGQKAEALAAYEAKGPSEAARQTGIPVATIGRWARQHQIATRVVPLTKAATEAMAARNRFRREDVRTRLLDLIERVLDQMSAKPEPTPTGMRELATALSILIDKLRIESGEVTERVHTSEDVTFKTVSDEQLNADLARVLRGLPGAKDKGKRGGGGS